MDKQRRRGKGRGFSEGTKWEMVKKDGYKQGRVVEGKE